METFQVDTSYEVTPEYVYQSAAGAGMLCDVIPKEWVDLLMYLSVHDPKFPAGWDA